MPAPRFSVVITSYNQREYVRIALDSALSQNRSLAEIIVVDDGSKDGSPEMLEGYGDAIQLVKFAANQGAIPARNHGASLAKGEYIIFLDGDDLFMPGAFEVYERIVQTLHPAMILARRIWFEGTPPPASETPGVAIEYADYPNLMEKDRPYGTCASAMIAKRDAYEAIGGWSPGIFHMDTVDYTTKLGFSGRTILINSPFTVFYRVHSANSINNALPFLRMGHKIIGKERAGEYPGGPARKFTRYAWLGGVVLFWTKRSFRRGFYWEGLKLAADGWSMLLAAVLLRAKLVIKGRKPFQTLS
jgi:glycosyltransferase involved in cell wall biosynthesis